MKKIKTNLSEEMFLSRIDSMCTQHKWFNAEYAESDVFTLKRKKQSFRIGRHFANMPMMRSDGYYSEFIYGKYIVNSLGTVDVNYRFGKPILHIFPFVLCCAFGLPIFVCLLYDAIFNSLYQWDGVFVTLIFSFVGLFNLFVCYKKDRIVLEEHLHKICFFED